MIKQTKKKFNEINTQRDGKSKRTRQRKAMVDQNQSKDLKTYFWETK